MSRAVVQSAVVALAATGLFLLPAAYPASAQKAEPQQISYAKVNEIFQANCTRCHGKIRQRAKIDLSTYETTMKGGEHGPIVKPGDPKGSVLVQALRGTNGKRAMPFRSAPLLEQQIRAIELWVKQGAKK